MGLVSAVRHYNIYGQVVLYSVAAALFTVSPTAAARDDPGVVQTVAPLFASHSPLLVTIEAPLTTLMQERPKKRIS